MPKTRKRPLDHAPGEVLRREYMEPRNLTPEDMASALGLSMTRVEDILEGLCVLTPDEALRLGRLFGVDPRFWMHLQADCLLEEARAALEAGINARVRPLDRPSS